MATYIKTLKEDNGDITYPQTKAEAVLLNNGSDLETEISQYVTAEEIGSTAAVDYSEILSRIYPVGSIYMSATLSTAAQVNATLGGTWTAWGAGRVPVGVDTTQTEFNTVEETGGEKTHKLLSRELPTIEGTFPHIAGDEASVTGVFSHIFTGSSYNEGLQSSTSVATKHKMSFGNNTPHNNLQPYITCYMYKRIS